MKFNGKPKWMEVFCAYAIEQTICFKDLIVGDDGNKCLPDIYNGPKTLGIEVVQLEKDCDLDMKYVWQSYNQNNGNYQKVKEFCDKEYPGVYEIVEHNGKVGCFYSSEEAHTVDWMKEIYSNNLRKKLEKLNNGNYSGINSEILLCVSIIQRNKGLYDIQLILYLYQILTKQFNNEFSKIVVITFEKLYLLEPKKVENITPITSNDIIYDFKIKGENYLSIIEYDFDEINTITRKYFDEH